MEPFGVFLGLFLVFLSIITLKKADQPLFFDIKYPDSKHQVDFHTQPQIELPRRLIYNYEPKKTVNIVGHFLPSLYYTNKKWLDWLQRLHKNHVAVKLLAGPDIDDDSRQTIIDLVESGIIEYRLVDERLTKHDVNIDDKHLWCEPEHVEVEPTEATLYLDYSPEKMNDVVDKFNSRWKTSTPIKTKEQIIKIPTHTYNDNN